MVLSWNSVVVLGSTRRCLPAFFSLSHPLFSSRFRRLTSFFRFSRLRRLAQFPRLFALPGSWPFRKHHGNEAAFWSRLSLSVWPQASCRSSLLEVSCGKNGFRVYRHPGEYPNAVPVSCVRERAKRGPSPFLPSLPAGSTGPLWCTLYPSVHHFGHVVWKAPKTSLLVLVTSQLTRLCTRSLVLFPACSGAPLSLACQHREKKAENCGPGVSFLGRTLAHFSFHVCTPLTPRFRLEQRCSGGRRRPASLVGLFPVCVFTTNATKNAFFPVF